MRHRQIIGVDDEQLGVGGVAEAHVEGLIARVPVMPALRTAAHKPAM